MAATLAPLAVRKLMPDGYLKLIQQRHQKKTGVLYSPAMISYVLTNARTQHPLWNTVVAVARKEKKRLETEVQQNAEYLRSLEA